MKDHQELPTKVLCEAEGSGTGLAPWVTGSAARAEQLGARAPGRRVLRAAFPEGCVS